MPANRDPLLVAFGAAVREVRVARRITQERLAELAGIHRTYVGDVERGLRNIGLVNVGRLADALGIGLADLMAATEQRRAGR